MPTRPVGVTDNVNASGIADLDVIERPSYDIVTTTTADPGSGGTSLAVTLRNRFPQSGDFKVRVEAEVMLVTAGQGTGAGNFTVTRGQDGTTAVAHASGVQVALVLGVQRVEPVDGSRIVTYRGRFSTFSIPGRAGTAGQKIASIHNATGSAVKVRLNKIEIDHTSTVVKAVTVLPPTVRLVKVTVLPTNGTAGVKVAQDSALSSSASVTVLGDASADNTGSGTALTATLTTSVYAQEYEHRIITAVGEEGAPNIVFLEDEAAFLQLNALEGAVVFLDYTGATQNATTDRWIVMMEWEEYTLA